MKIISFSFAGGSKYAFQKFTSKTNDLIVIEYPGRGIRIHEDLIYDIELFIEDLLNKVKNEILTNEKYIIYGHSMGALVGYLICQKIEEVGLKKPLKLVVSGKKMPSIEREVKLSHLPDKELWQEVIKLGGIPDELLNYPELIDFYTPILKADFAAIENYEYVKKEKLTIPIDVFYGSEEARKEEMQGWKDETIENVTITELEGNHFFIFDHVDFFINYFNNLTKNLIYQ
ncbi:surfactin synthase thioesterase subunit [Flavobacterium sp. 90]|uniref:thioesterase II family protein n=1 Tax=unclassified Flavobacterium TaxID=196869 RepID=UPI000EB19803|nr:MULTISPECIES: thioesterase domain-containing protein [unclassified Flavobacterium]RKR04568.1 surfactin synthase thioesterase subunit [Flavobacterium sp. 81]TCK55897.1 surfactin synthase thioesterase subunit [Flavobacterium sp. 90]